MVEEKKESPHSVVVYVLDMMVSEFELKSRYNVLFWTNTLRKGNNPIILFGYGLNCTSAVLLPG